MVSKIRNWLGNVDNIFKILAASLFTVYVLQLYVGYDIDRIQVFDVGMTLFMIFLRWTTIVTVGFACISPFFKGKAFKFILICLGPIVGIMNLALFNQNIIAWGPETANLFRKTMFILEQILILAISISSLVTFIIKKEYKETKYWRIPIILPLMFIAFSYQPLLQIVLGNKGQEVSGFSSSHIVYLSLNFIFILAGYIVMKKKPQEDKELFFAVIVYSGIFNFFYEDYGGFGNLPFHLCNAAMIMMFIAFLFKAKGLFYFTYFVNVIGALFAMLMPNVTSDAYNQEVIRFWYNHIYAFSVPILGVALRVFDRPKLQMIFRAIMWFTFYFLLVAILNAILSNYQKIDFFFINSNFFFEKLNMSTSIKDNHTWIIMMKDWTLVFYPLFHFVVYIIYIGLMFVMWFIYDTIYQVSDSHYALRLKKKLMKQKDLELKELLKDKNLNEPLYDEVKDMIEIKDFTKVYSGSKKASVENLNITVPNGCVYGFLGHNGAGKSTTIKALVGIHSITKGKIIVEGYDVEKQSVQAKLNIGYVSDNHAVYEKLTGREYINYIADLYMVSKEDRDERIKKYCEMFNLTDAIDREIKGYSHGMKQKIVVISSLIHDPKVWVLDEPLTGLDPMSSHQIKECMREHANRGNIVFFSSHVIEVVEKICDRICIINHGHLCCEYSIQELHEKGINLEELYLKYFGNEGVTDASQA